MKNVLHFASLLAVLALVSACGEASPDPPPTFSLTGTSWLTDCLGGYKEMLTFSSSDFVQAEWNYSGSPACTGTVTTTTYNHRYALGGASTAALHSAQVTAHEFNYTDPGDSHTKHCLVYVDTVGTPNKLYLGMYDSTHDGSSPSNRCVQLNASFAYVKVLTVGVSTP